MLINRTDDHHQPAPATVPLHPSRRAGAQPQQGIQAANRSPGADRPTGSPAHNRGSKSRWFCKAPRPARSGSRNRGQSQAKFTAADGCWCSGESSPTGQRWLNRSGCPPPRQRSRPAHNAPASLEDGGAAGSGAPATRQEWSTNDCLAQRPTTAANPLQHLGKGAGVPTLKEKLTRICKHPGCEQEWPFHHIARGREAVQLSS